MENKIIKYLKCCNVSMSIHRIASGLDADPITINTVMKKLEESGIALRYTTSSGEGEWKLQKNVVCYDCDKRVDGHDTCLDCYIHGIGDSSADKTVIVSELKNERDLVAGNKHDFDKLQMNLIPFDALEEIVKVLMFGAKKYKPDNWKKVPDAVNRYESALLRHFSAYQRGENNDPESGISHIAHMGCNILFLLWFDKNTRDK